MPGGTNPQHPIGARAAALVRKSDLLPQPGGFEARIGVAAALRGDVLVNGMRLDVRRYTFGTGDFLNRRDQLLGSELLELLFGVPDCDHAPSAVNRTSDMDHAPLRKLILGHYPSVDLVIEALIRALDLGDHYNGHRRLLLTRLPNWLSCRLTYSRSPAASRAAT
jgi:hypothetical protein